MKWPHNKKRIIAVSVLLLSVSMGYQYFKNIQIKELKQIEIAKQSNEHNTKRQKKSKKSIKTNINKNIKKNKRQPSSVVKKTVLQIYQDRKVVGRIGPHADFPIINKISKDWEQKTYQALNKYMSKDHKLKIKKIDSAVFFQHKAGMYVEHVQIEIKDPTGLTSTYDAYVNSQTGHIIRTWNRTRFEIRPTVTLNSHGNEFKAPKLKKDI